MINAINIKEKHKLNSWYLSKGIYTDWPFAKNKETNQGREVIFHRQGHSDVLESKMTRQDNNI